LGSKIIITTNKGEIVSTVVVLGAGVSGHTAALFLKKKLGKQHNVIVVSPNSNWNWIPSNIWVGVGMMKKEDVIFPLAPVYQKQGIQFEQAKALSIHPDGKQTNGKPFVKIEYTHPDKKGEQVEIQYDFLINATGPKLKFYATEGLGPDEGHTLSVCTADHALEANEKFQKAIERMKKGETIKFVIGTGHGTCTCQGAAFEYIMNIDHELRQRKLRDKAHITYITNEYNLGDFGVGGMHIKRGGYITHSKVFAESLMAEHDIHWVTRAHVKKVGPNTIYWENLYGEEGELEFDFTMLIPPFSGVGLSAMDVNGDDITDQMFKPNGFMIVDSDYTPKDFDNWSADDWPKTLQNPTWKNIFAVGIAFAPPHAISKPMKAENGTAISPTPPRTGMPSAMMGKAVALSIVDMIKKGKKEPTHEACMSKMGAACVASAGNSMINGSAVAMTMYPIVPDYKKYPEHGRHMTYSFGEVGLAAHWIKFILHYLFIYKAKARPLWWLIPE
jgi:sulfide:quinone oxidoreductase